MSSITIDFDTVEKTLVVKLDGQTLENVRHVDIFKFNEDATIDISQVAGKFSEGDGIVTRTMISADKKEVTEIQEVSKTESLSKALKLS
jgi:hypothetical protein